MSRLRHRVFVAAFVSLALVLGACSSDSTSTADDAEPAASAPASLPSESPETADAATPEDTQPTSDSAGIRIAAVGDLVCAYGTKIPQIQIENGHEPVCNPRGVSRLVTDGDYDRFLPLGDLQYSYGGYWRYVKYWDRYYGSVKHITKPVAGNHEAYADFTGYVKYFGPQRTHMPAKVGQVHIGQNPGRITGYYSYDLGEWHMIALNSQLCMNKMWNLRTYWTSPIPGGGCGPNDPQMRWLAKDLAANPDGCSLAYFHHPRFLVNDEGDGPEKQAPLVDALHAGGVDVILVGHEHSYQRWGPMDANGDPDPSGFTQFIVGTGGNSYRPLGAEESEWPEAVQAAHTGTFGILDLELHADAYDFSFVAAPGEKPFEDAGTAACN